MTNTTPTTFINSCLDVNASWREAFNQLGCLALFDVLVDALEYHVVTSSVAEECGLTEDQALDAVVDFVVTNNYVWNEDTVRQNFDFAYDTLTEYNFDAAETLSKITGLDLQIKGRLIADALNDGDTDSLEKVDTPEELQQVLYYIRPESPELDAIKSKCSDFYHQQTT